MSDGHDTPIGPCPACGSEHEAASSPFTDAAPEPGDFSICIRCAAVLVFDRELKRRQVTRRELRAVHVETQREIARVRRAILEARRLN